MRKGRGLFSKDIVLRMSCLLRTTLISVGYLVKNQGCGICKVEGALLTFFLQCLFYRQRLDD